MVKRLLVTTPFLQSIGGTELEAVLTAVHFYDSNRYHQVALFSPQQCNRELVDLLIENRSISFLHYPAFFSSPLGLFLNRFFKKLGFQKPFLETFYWFFISLRYTHFFVLTYPGCMYFFPLFTFYKRYKKYMAKITMWHFTPLNVAHQKLYRKFNTIVVFNESQQVFWEQNNGLFNVKHLDIMVLNESNLLAVPELQATSFSTDIVTFGYLGRLSREKNIEDMILLMDFLNHKNQKKCHLLIQGGGDVAYIRELEMLVVQLQLEEFVSFRKTFVNPNQTHHFYSQIQVLLVTSKHEGGPMTSLEAAASGRYVMGYDIGAMQDRFGSFPYVVNSNLDSLCASALAFLNLTTFEKLAIINKFSHYYISKLSNASKGQQLNQLFE